VCGIFFSSGAFHCHFGRHTHCFPIVISEAIFLNQSNTLLPFFATQCSFSSTISQAFPMLKFFHQGNLYNYRGPRDVEHLMEFALVGVGLFS